MAEEQEAGPPVPVVEQHKLKEVTIFLPMGAYVVKADMVHIDTFPNGTLYLDVTQGDGSVERFVGVPFVLKLATNRLVQPVTKPIIAVT